ncbi:MAG: hypothetical protein JST25_00120 [Actinobacteria bacterium]|nr:hypothetical protein [Actinomycetota bacterium]
MAERPTGSTASATFFRIAYAVVAVLPAAALVAFLVGSLFLSGGKVSDSARQMWAPVVPYPLFVVPTTALVIWGIGAVALAVGVVVTMRSGDEPRVQRLFGPTLASAVAAFLLSFLTPDGGVRRGDTFIGDQWIGTIFSIAALAVLLVGLGVRRSRQRVASSTGVDR